MKFSLIFIAALMLDGLILPAFFGLRESFLSLLVLITPVLFMNLTNQNIILVSFFAFVLEIFKGISFGNLTLPFLLMLIILLFIQKFLDIRHTSDAGFISGKTVLTVGISVILFYILLFFYGHGSINIGYFKPIIVLTIISEALLTAFVFYIVFKQKTGHVS